MTTRQSRRHVQIDRFNTACRDRDVPLAIRRDRHGNLGLYDLVNGRAVHRSKFTKVIVFLGIARARIAFGIDFGPLIAPASAEVANGPALALSH